MTTTGPNVRYRRRAGCNCDCGVASCAFVATSGRRFLSAYPFLNGALISRPAFGSSRLGLPYYLQRAALASNLLLVSSPSVLRLRGRSSVDVLLDLIPAHAGLLKGSTVVSLNVSTAWNYTTSMNMFDENFSFDKPRSPSVDSSNASSTRDHSRSPSPCSPTSAYPPLNFSVTDLAARFSDARVRPDSQIMYDSCAAYAAADDDAGWTLESTAEAESELRRPSSSSRRFPQRAPPRPHSPSQRSQRQANARLLCFSAHRADIAALVSRMVNTNDQCSVASGDLNPSRTDDDGYDSSDGSTPVQSRRASVASIRSRRGSELRGMSSAGVCKSTRLRRESRLTRVKSSDKA